MTDTVLNCELLPGCTVAAVLERVGQGMEWRTFLDGALNDSLMTWAFTTSANAAVVGDTRSLSALDKHIATFARNSYKLSAPVPVTLQRLTLSRQASGKIKKQSSSADQYACITIRAEPTPETHNIQLVIPHSNDIPPELHKPGLPEAILDGICLASLAQDPARPFVGFQVAVLDGKWHDVDSHSGVFKKATCMAMSDILSGQPVTH